jgi:hypothetical protein
MLQANRDYVNSYQRKYRSAQKDVGRINGMAKTGMWTKRLGKATMCRQSVLQGSSFYINVNQLQLATLLLM